MKAMETIQDLIEEAKIRTVWCALCIFAFAYFLSHTSKSMWMNVPIAILLVSAIRILVNEVEFHWKVRPEVRPRTYLSYLEKKQISLNDARLSTTPPTTKWKKKVDSPIVEDAINEFINKILQDFVLDLWYSDITPDKEAPELIGAVIAEAIGEISGRVKQLNLVDLLTRDVVDLIGDHLDMFRRNQAAIGADVMGTLSIEERDERLKHHLMASKELHPALISPECEQGYLNRGPFRYVEREPERKTLLLENMVRMGVLQRLIGGVLAVVLRPRDAQSPLVQCIARELVTCLVVQPVMSFVSPTYINELIECLLIAAIDYGTSAVAGDQSNTTDSHVDPSVSAVFVKDHDVNSRKHASTHVSGPDVISTKLEHQREVSSNHGDLHGDPTQMQPAEWVRGLEAATQRRTETLTPENLENMWTKGRDYKKTVSENAEAMFPTRTVKGLKSNCPVPSKDPKELLINRYGSLGKEDMALLGRKPDLSYNACTHDTYYNQEYSHDFEKKTLIVGEHRAGKLENNSALVSNVNKSGLKRSSSTSALISEIAKEKTFHSERGLPALSEDFYSTNFGRPMEEHKVKNRSDILCFSEGLHVSKLRCHVIGAYFEKIGSTSFAVYSIAVTDAQSTTWFVKRRYSNFERLHRHLKDIPNYTLHLPPKRIFSSSTEDNFVHQRCIQLDKYLQDLLSVANVAEQHEVWDFLSVSSKNYSFGRSSSVMRTLAVNVDDAMDDIVRQVKGVSDGLMRKVSGPASYLDEPSPSVSGKSLSWHADDTTKRISRHVTEESADNLSDNEDEVEKSGSNGPEEIKSISQANGWHSDNEVNSKVFPPRVIKGFSSQEKHVLEVKFGLKSSDGYLVTTTSGGINDPIGMPPEWAPPNVSVPMLNLVDKVFQLKRRGWLRRQVFWMSKQILQLMMEDAIDDWLLGQIHWLRRDDIIAQGIKWVQDVLWPDGIFFLPLTSAQREKMGTAVGSKTSKAGSFEQQLEAARRASDIKKMLLGGAPSALVSLIGHKQYKRCAKDIYYFSQCTICVKQLAYGVLELVLISIFPELRDLVMDVHKQMGVKTIYS